MNKNLLTNAKHIVEFTSTLKAQRYIKNWNEFTLLYLGKKKPLNIIFKDGTKLYVRPNDQRTIHEIALRDDYKIKDMAPEAFIVWKDCGVLDENGAERPAYEVWKRYFSMSK